MRTKTLALAILLFLLPTGALFATDRAVRDESNRLYREARSLVNRGQISAALTRFERALAYRPRVDTLWNIAHAHLHLGHRDMTLWFMDRYLMWDRAGRESLEVQQVLMAISESSEPLPRGRGPLFDDRLREAYDAVESGEATAADPSQQIFGSGTRSPEAEARWRQARDYGTMLFRSGLDQLVESNWENSQSFFERSLAYRTLRNSAYNLAAIHLDFGRRDLAVHFYRMYITNTPQIHDNAEVEAALQAITDSPPRIRSQTRRNELSDRFSEAVDRALGVTPTPVPQATQEQESANE
jgi:tetratricopeptide (TPR) repeat protein